VGNDIGYERTLRRWGREVADVLERNARGGVPQEVATHHRHYNVWQSICVGCAVLLACRVAWMQFIARSGPGDLGWVDAALFAVAVLTAWPAQRVDAFHRRRKWFD
jgi:hypothetical protein